MQQLPTVAVNARGREPRAPEERHIEGFLWMSRPGRAGGTRQGVADRRSTMADRWPWSVSLVCWPAVLLIGRCIWTLSGCAAAPSCWASCCRWLPWAPTRDCFWPTAAIGSRPSGLAGWTASRARSGRDRARRAAVGGDCRRRAARVAPAGGQGRLRQRSGGRWDQDQDQDVVFGSWKGVGCLGMAAGQPVTVNVADATVPLWRPLAWKLSLRPG